MCGGDGPSSSEGKTMKRRMGLIVFDRVTMLDVSGPAEVLNKADVISAAGAGGEHDGYELM
ncbi:hypothetical protein QP932_08665 [Corynebacterium freneyi]|nr:hypothetical protein [Corynebacterium freneyi]